MDKLKRGTQVVYVPSHLEGDDDWGYPNGLQPGFVTTGPTKDGSYYVRYWALDGKKIRYPFDLRTKANSELTPGHCLVVEDSVASNEVEFALARYC